MRNSLSLISIFCTIRKQSITYLQLNIRLLLFQALFPVYQFILDLQYIAVLHFALI